MYRKAQFIPQAIHESIAYNSYNRKAAIHCVLSVKDNTHRMPVNFSRGYFSTYCGKIGAPTGGRIKAKKDVLGMDMFEEARAMSGTMELCRITQKELAERMGVSQSYVANKLRLLALSPHIERLIKKHNVSERHARAILRLESEDEQLDILEKVISRELTVRECEALVDLAIDSYMPSVVAKAESQKRVDVFVETLKRSLTTLRSLGIDVTERTSYYGEKMYITVCFDGI